MCGSSLSRDRMSNPSGSFYGFEAISVPVQDRQIEAIAQKLVVLGGKVLLNCALLHEWAIWRPKLDGIGGLGCS
jgi:hypothetical protein